jgi:hypothetical protein
MRMKWKNQEEPVSQHVKINLIYVIDTFVFSQLEDGFVLLCFSAMSDGNDLIPVPVFLEGLVIFLSSRYLLLLQQVQSM